MKTGFSWGSSAKKTQIYAKYTQTYFRVNVDPFNHAADLFDPTTPLADIQAAMPPDPCAPSL